MHYAKFERFTKTVRMYGAWQNHGNLLKEDLSQWSSLNKK